MWGFLLLFGISRIWFIISPSFQAVDWVHALFLIAFHQWLLFLSCFLFRHVGIFFKVRGIRVTTRERDKTTLSCIVAKMQSILYTCTEIQSHSKQCFGVFEISQTCPEFFLGVLNMKYGLSMKCILCILTWRNSFEL